MPRVRSLILAGFVAFGYGLAGAGAEPAPRHFAVVVGLSEYASLPPQLRLSSAHGEAARVALALREESHVDDVRLITDAEATRERIYGVFRDDLSKLVTWRDTVLFYFVGHGLGADFDQPYLLPYDTNPDDIEGTAISVEQFGTSLQQWIPAGNFVIVTDAAHRGDLGGLALLGPAAGSWPDMGSSTALISSAALREVSEEGVFARHFIDGVTGAGDSSRDGLVTVAELYRYLLLAVPTTTGNRQNPASAGKYDTNLVVAKGVVFKDTDANRQGGGDNTVVIREQVAAAPEVIMIREQAATDGGSALALPTHTVDKAKFVFKGIASPTVACRDQQPVACDPTCYVTDFLAGPCTVSGFNGNARLSGSTFVAARGVYTCEPKANAMVCDSPNFHQ